MKTCNLKLILPSFNESFYLFHSEPGLAVLLYVVAMLKKQDTSERESCFPQTSTNCIYNVCNYMYLSCIYKIYISYTFTSTYRHITLGHTLFPHMSSANPPEIPIEKSDQLRQTYPPGNGSRKHIPPFGKGKSSVLKKCPFLEGEYVFFVPRRVQ